MRYHAVLLISLAVAGCATKNVMRAPPPPVVALPADPLSGSKIVVFPLNTIRIDTTMGWDKALGDRRQTLDRVDSIINAALTGRLPQVIWLPPSALRKAAAQAPGMLAEPDQMSTALLQIHALARVPDPLASQMRQLTGVATGGRYALVPANLWFERQDATRGRAKLVVALVDVRRSAVSWSATLTGVGENPWEAIVAAAHELTMQETGQ